MNSIQPAQEIQFLAYFLKENELMKLVLKVCQSPAASDLLNRVQKKRADQKLPPLTVRFINKEEAGTKRENESAHCNPKTGEIVIRSDQPQAEKLHSFIFELANLSQKERKDQIERDIKNGVIKSDIETATKIEEIEYETDCITNQIFEDSIQGKHWEASLQSCISKWKNFEDFLRSAKKQGHFDFYVTLAETARNNRNR